MSEAVIGLGSNLENLDANLLNAVQAVGRLSQIKITGISSIYASPPESLAVRASQNEYHNMAIKLETAMSPLSLLGACLGIEAAMGRVHTANRDAARVIDLDLLLYEGVKSESFELSLPHPRLLQRAFVLLPLKELYPSGRAPGIFFEPNLKEVNAGEVRKLEQRITMEV
jgi:2-amino-4-hydroxy-6-hydroxymethyldihydropteridine diphosphokinase